MEFDINKYSKILDKIEDNLNLYYNKYLDCTRFILYLSNDEKIEIDYNTSSIPHLLGIDTNALISTGVFSNNSFEVLNSIIENPNRLIGLINNNHIKSDRVFSNYIDEKLDNFENICGMNIWNIEFVSKYNKENSYTTEENPLDGEYYIGFRNDKNTLSVVGFKEDKGIYYPITNLKFDYHSEEKDKFLKRLLKNQKLMYVQTFRKNTFKNGELDRLKLFYNHEQKEEKMELIDRYADEYGAVCDTHKNYLYYIKKSSNLHEEKIGIWNLINKITDAVNNKKIIQLTELEKDFDEIDRSLISLIGAINDSLVNSDANGNSNQYSYSDIITELENAKKEIIKKDELIEKINQKNNELVSRNSVLESEKNDLDEKLEKVRTIVK